MSKSLRTRFNRAYQLLASAQSCPTCGLSSDDWPVEIYMVCIDNPDDQTYFPNPPDFSRCPSFNAPSVLVFWKPESREFPS